MYVVLFSVTAMGSEPATAAVIFRAAGFAETVIVCATAALLHASSRATKSGATLVRLGNAARLRCHQ